MSSYVISDIHGCYDEFARMLEKIGFTSGDELILGGDYVDRGPKSYEMLRWLERAPSNVTTLKGNHDVEFSYYVDLMQQIRRSEMPDMDELSALDCKRLYEATWRTYNEEAEGVFDHYGTIEELILKKGASFAALRKWSELLNGMAYYREKAVAGKRCIVVHAGYIDNLKDSYLHGKYNSRETFFLYARDDAYIHGGVENGLIVAGHTPTVSKGEITSNGGKVYRFVNESKKCTYYDIDCGCAFRKVIPEGRLAALRLEDEQVFYV